MDTTSDFEALVARYYALLYQFAFGLTRVEADACDLTQQTFLIWASKGHQLRDPSKVKTWLFTTLHRQFLESQRRSKRFVHEEIGTIEHALPTVSSGVVERVDGSKVLEALGRVDPIYRAAVSLFYLEDWSYQEISEILDVPLGTVKSRISRGVHQLQKMLTEGSTGGRREIGEM